MGRISINKKVEDGYHGGGGNSVFVAADDEASLSWIKQGGIKEGWCRRYSGKWVNG